MKTNTDKHTPGPWALNNDGDLILNARGKTLAELRVNHDASDRITEFNANARLIAAAPALLAALERISDYSERPLHCTLGDTGRIARAAIAAAKGGAK